MHVLICIKKHQFNGFMGIYAFEAFIQWLCLHDISSMLIFAKYNDGILSLFEISEKLTQAFGFAKIHSIREGC